MLSSNPVLPVAIPRLSGLRRRRRLPLGYCTSALHAVLAEPPRCQVERQQLIFNGSKLVDFAPADPTSMSEEEQFRTADVMEGSPTKQIQAYITSNGAPGGEGTEDQLDAYRMLDAPPVGHVPQTLQNYGIKKFSTIHLVETPIADLECSSPRAAKLFREAETSTSIPRDFNTVASSPSPPPPTITIRSIHHDTLLTSQMNYDERMSCGALKQAFAGESRTDEITT